MESIVKTDLFECLVDKKDLAWYEDPRNVAEEVNSTFYDFLSIIGVDTFIDVGANIGLHSLICLSKLNLRDLVAIEADPSLINMLRKNITKIGAETTVNIINAIADNEPENEKTLCKCPSGSLDNYATNSENGRDELKVATIKIDDILSGIEETEVFPFLKFDIQGGEPAALMGTSKFLRNSKRWIARIEFAPAHLIRSNHSPVKFLSDMLETFHVYEFPKRSPYQNVRDLFCLGKLDKSSSKGFTEHVKKQKLNGRGEIDILLTPIPITALS